jgi:hypothetical protein
MYEIIKHDDDSSNNQSSKQAQSITIIDRGLAPLQTSFSRCTSIRVLLLIVETRGIAASGLIVGNNSAAYHAGQRHTGGSTHH